MADFKIDRQGIEVELQVLDTMSPTTKSEGFPIEGVLRKVSDNFHLDDGKAEYSSKPYKTLAEIEDDLSICIGAGMDTMEKNGAYGLAIGCQPFYKDFASGHVHTSIMNMNESSWIELRQRLYSAQPIIALLSQNSPALYGLRAADVRLVLSAWSAFTDFDSINQAHYQSLAYGENGNTLETRVGSSGPLFQIIGLAALIRVIITNNDVPIPVIHTKDNWVNVINYGSSSLCKVGLPVVGNYDGVKYKTVMIKTTDLFKIFYENNKDALAKELEGVHPITKQEVFKFYDLLANGYTLSDLVYSVFRNNEPDICNKTLFNLFRASYKREPILDKFTNYKHFMPIVSSFITLDQMKDEIGKVKESSLIKRVELMKKDYLAAFIGDIGIIKNVKTIEILRKVANDGKYLYKPAEKAIVEELINIKVLSLTNEARVVGADENLPLIVALAKQVNIF
jgi:hypothetical protein